MPRLLGERKHGGARGLGYHIRIAGETPSLTRAPRTTTVPRPVWSFRRRISGGLAALALWLALGSGAHAQPRDPTLTWRTLDTPHFTIHYHLPLGVLARRVAVVAERAHTTLVDVMGYTGGRRTHIILSDESDSANGSAIAIPYNHIRLYATAPSDMSPLGDYDDWLNTLVTHEHTHVVHLDQWGGVASLVNLLLGKVYAPNHIQPRWILEGVGTWQESERTSGGRMRSTMFDMYLRMDALEDRFFRIDQISNSVDRWPHGNIWYLYGSQFIRYIADHYGREAIASISRAYGDAVLPWGLNRAAQNATGKSFVELYDEFLEDRRAHYQAMEREVIARGRIEGERLTHHGEVARMPRFLDDGRVAYWRADGRSRTRVTAFELAQPDAQSELARVAGQPGYALHPSGRAIYYTRPDNHRDIYLFHDLFRRDLENGYVERLTHGMRAREPDISPDGRRVAFTINGAGTTHLALADLDDVAGTAVRILENDRFDQVFTPRFSPDGRTLAISRWQRGGYRDIQLIDVESGRVTAVTRDRAQDTGPAWSPDGRTLYFSSDRTGIANIYAHDLTTGRLRQVTNVVAGAYQPAISPDGAHLVYVGYTSYGFDLFHLDLRETAPRPAPPFVDTRPPPIDDDSLWDGLSRDYQPLETLWPRSYMLDLTDDGFGAAVGITLTGEDIAGWHRWRLRATTGFARGTMNADVDYEYRRLPLTIGAHLYRRERPRNDYFIEGQNREWIEHAIGGQLRLGYSFPGSFQSHSVALSWNPRWTDNLEPLGGRLDPNDPPPRFPRRGFHSELRASWSYSNVERYTYDISPSAGTALGVTFSLEDPAIGSAFHSVSITWAVRQYLPMPWGEHHVVALRYAGGISEGDPGHRDIFSVGGFPDVSIIDGLLGNLVLGGDALRGYPAYDRGGTQYHLAQVEYRFPIWRVNAGVLTLPVYLNRIHGAVYADVGDAFSSSFALDRFRVGVGGHLMIDFTLGYLLPFTLRVGYARGLMEGGIDQVYGHFGVPF